MLKVEFSFSFVKNKLIFFVYTVGESLIEKEHEIPVFNFLSNKIRESQSDDDRSLKMCAYDENMRNRIFDILKHFLASAKTEFPKIELTGSVTEIPGDTI